MEEDVYEDLEAKALSSIQLSVADVLQELEEKTTATEIWLKFKSIYMAKSLTNQLNLKIRQLRKICMS